MGKIKFKDFPTGNESGKFLINPFWLEHLLNLFFQGYISELWGEMQETILNQIHNIENITFGLISDNLSKKHLNLFLNYSGKIRRKKNEK